MIYPRKLSHYNLQHHLEAITYVPAEDVVILTLFEGVVSDELAVRLRSGDALAAGRVDGDGSVLGNVEVRRGLCASLDRSSNNVSHLTLIYLLIVFVFTPRFTLFSSSFL